MNFKVEIITELANELVRGLKSRFKSVYSLHSNTSPSFGTPHRVKIS